MYMYFRTSALICWYWSPLGNGLISAETPGTRTGPAIKDIAMPMLFMMTAMAVDVVLWLAGNHLEERRGAPVTATGPENELLLNIFIILGYETKTRQKCFGGWEVNSLSLPLQDRRITNNHRQTGVNVLGLLNRFQPQVWNVGLSIFVFMLVKVQSSSCTN